MTSHSRCLSFLLLACLLAVGACHGGTKIIYRGGARADVGPPPDADAGGLEPDAEAPVPDALPPEPIADATPEPLIRVDQGVGAEDGGPDAAGPADDGAPPDGDTAASDGAPDGSPVADG